MSAAPRPIAALVEFDQVLGRVKACHAAQLAPMMEYAPAELAERLTQRFAQLRQHHFVVARCAGEPLDLEGIRVDPASGAIRLSLARSLSLLWDFLARWSYTALVIVAAARRRTPGVKGTLVFGVGPQDLFRGGSDAAFLAFCAAGPIAPLREATCLLVQAAAAPRPDMSVKAEYSRSPLHGLARRAGVTPLKALALLAVHLAALGSVVLHAARRPAILLLARDFSETVLAAELDRSGAIESVVFTNSNYSSQPLWMWARPGRRLRAHMAWYSQNVRPFLRPGDPAFPVIPARRLIRADTMWVWIASFAAYLSGLGLKAEMRVVGPILWHLPPPLPAAPADALQIAIFDMEPLLDETVRDLRIFDYYYTMATMQRFLRDIIECAQRAAQRLGTRVRFVLKHKREFDSRRDPGYSGFIDSLVAAHEGFTLLRPDTSLYEIMSASAVAISIPYSSPVFVASHMGKAALYYEPNGELVPEFDAAPLLQYVSGPKALEEAIHRGLGEVLANRGAFPATAATGAH